MELHEMAMRISHCSILQKCPTLLYYLLETKYSDKEQYISQYTVGLLTITGLFTKFLEHWRSQKGEAETTVNKLAEILRTNTYVHAAELLSQENVIPHLNTEEPPLKPFRFGLSDGQVTNFCERFHETQKLQEFFNAKVKNLAVIGPPGIGKSTLIKEFLVQENAPWHLIWLKGPQLFQDIDRFEKKVHIKCPNYSCNKPLLLEKLINANFGMAQSTIIVIDEIEHVDEELSSVIEKLMDFKNLTCILISRNTKVCGLANTTLRVDAFSTLDAVKFIKNGFSCETELAEKLCLKLYNYPLALQQARRYVNKKSANLGTPCTLLKCLEHLESNPSSVFSQELELVDQQYNNNLKTMSIIDLEIDKLENPLARRVLQLLPYFPMEYILTATIRKLLKRSELTYTIDDLNFEDEKSVYTALAIKSLISVNLQTVLLYPYFHLPVKLYRKDKENVIINILNLVKHQIFKLNKKERFISNLIPFNANILLPSFTNETLVSLWESAVEYPKVAEQFKEVLIWIPSVNHSMTFCNKCIDKLVLVLNLATTDFGLLQIRRRLAQNQFLNRKLDESMTNYALVVKELRKHLNHSIQLFETLEEYAWVLMHYKDYEGALSLVNESIQGKEKQAAYDSIGVTRARYCKAKILIASENENYKQEALEQFSKVLSWYIENYGENFLNGLSVKNDISLHFNDHIYFNRAQSQSKPVAHKFSSNRFTYILIIIVLIQFVWIVAREL